MRRRCRPRDQRAGRWGGGCRCRRAPCRRYARGAARNHRHPAPSRCRSPGRAVPESTATPCRGSRVTPALWPVVPRLDQPMPARWTPACRAATRCAAHNARSDRRPARRRSAPRSPGRRRKTGAPAGGSPPAAPPPQRQPVCAHTGCAPEPTRHHTQDKRPSAPAETPRFAPTHRPRRVARSLHPLGAAGEPQRHHGYDTTNMITFS